MSLPPPIHPSLMKRAEAYAREHSTSVGAVVEEALSRYLGARPDSPAPASQTAELPVATTLKMASPQLCDMSHGKLLDRADDANELSKSR
jgi:hypothetical protein